MAAVALGANVIEKHFTTSKKLSGPDQRASLSENELTNLIKSIRKVEVSLEVIKNPSLEELRNSKFIRKFIVAKKN